MNRQGGWRGTIDSTRAGVDDVHSVAVRADDLTAGLGAERPPDVPGDRILGEPDAPVTHERIHTARVGAIGAVDETVIRIIGGIRGAVIEPAAAVRILGVVGGLDGV